MPASGRSDRSVPSCWRCLCRGYTSVGGATEWVLHVCSKQLDLGLWVSVVSLLLNLALYSIEMKIRAWSISTPFWSVWSVCCCRWWPHLEGESVRGDIGQRCIAHRQLQSHVDSNVHTLCLLVYRCTSSFSTCRCWLQCAYLYYLFLLQGCGSNKDHAQAISRLCWRRADEGDRRARGIQWMNSRYIDHPDQWVYNSKFTPCHGKMYN